MSRRNGRGSEEARLVICERDGVYDLARKCFVVVSFQVFFLRLFSIVFNLFSTVSNLFFFKKPGWVRYRRWEMVRVDNTYTYTRV